MSRFDRYLFTQYFLMFGFFSLILLFIYWINKAIALFDNLISDGQTFFVFLEFSILTIPPIIPIIAPLAAFAAAIFVTNRLKNDSELTIMQATVKVITFNFFIWISSNYFFADYFSLFNSQIKQHSFKAAERGGLIT